MGTTTDNEWAAIRRVIDTEKAHAWTEMESFSLPADQPIRRRMITPPRLAAVAALVITMVVAGLIFTLNSRGTKITLDQLPFFATAKAGHPSTGVSPREREMGRRLDGWMALARQKPLSDLPPTGKMEQNNPGETRNSKSRTIRETMLQRFFLESDKHQEV